MTIGGISGLFSRALDGLGTAQRGMTVVANNIANVNTPGYTKQRLIQGSRAIFGDGTLGGGVFVTGISTLVDPFIERQMISELGDFGTLEGRKNTLASIEAITSDLDGSGLGSTISKFFDSWSQLAQNPSSGALRELVRESGRALTEKFQSQNSQLNEMRMNLSNSIDVRVDQVNAKLAQIASLNASIRDSNDDATKIELKNERQLVLREVASEMGVNYFEAGDETMTVQLEGSGFTLVSGDDAASLETMDDLTNGGDLTIKASVPGGSSADIDITANLTSGRLGGSLVDRNTTLNDQIDKLDQLAHTLITEFNDVHQDGYGLDGNNNHNFFNPSASAAGSSATISLDSGILTDLNTIAAAGADPTSSGTGDGANALLLVALRDQNLMDGDTKTFNQYYSGVAASIGIATGTLNRSYESKSKVVENLEVQRQNISGVNMDEEASDLIRYQKAFEASARVMSIASDMMETLMKL